jgi:DNA-binding beta-propeller fold protein YncE
LSHFPRAAVCAVVVLVLTVGMAQAVDDPLAPENLRCAEPNLSFDPNTQQIVYVWQDVVRYTQSLDDQGPQSVALDRNCNLYMVDSELNHVVKVSPTGDTLATWGSDGRGPGQFHRPGGIAVDGDGNIYVADSGNDRVQKLAPSGQVAEVWQYCLPGSNPCAPAPDQAPGHFFDPEGIAVDGQGNVYVSEVDNNRLQKLDHDGKPLAMFQGFSSPFGLSIDRAGNVYVADLNNNQVQKLSPSGQPLQAFGAGSVKQPRGVTVDADGNVYISDTQNHRVQKFAPDGTLVTQWRRCEDDPTICQFPNSGGGPGEFFYPRGATIDAAGDLYIADTSNNRVQRLYQTVVPLPSPDDSGD